ncbi:MAG: hypothetical protein HY854_16480 [Burkholderiales bacterium]|nr:hypothetical protein [Burkholderiales bacterium]
MQTALKVAFLAASAAIVGCADMRPTIPGDPTVAGKHLVYRDLSGNPLRQFDYPSDDICRKVEAVAGRSARCQPTSLAATMQAQATLRYVPPGILVHGHYPDMARCQTDTRELAAGVEVISACATKH